MEDVGWAVVRVGAVWLGLVLALIVVPSALGISLGISEAYMWVLVKTLEVGGGRRPLKPGALSRSPGRTARGWVGGGPPEPVPPPWGDSKMATPVRCRPGPK